MSNPISHKASEPLGFHQRHPNRHLKSPVTIS
nr:MAG TPA: hypothetical protein [Caudoviricetes sp.]